MIKHVITNVVALGDGGGFVELPVDAEINPALAIFLFRLGKSRETARHERAHVASVVFGNAVELVGDDGEGDVIGAEESAHDLKDRATKAAVAGRVRWKWRSKVRASQIAGRRT